MIEENMAIQGAINDHYIQGAIKDHSESFVTH